MVSLIAEISVGLALLLDSQQCLPLKPFTLDDVRSGGVAQSSMICDSLYVLLEILQINYSATISDATGLATVELVTVGLRTIGLATVGLATVGLATVGLATIGLATVGLASAFSSHHQRWL